MPPRFRWRPAAVPTPRPRIVGSALRSRLLLPRSVRAVSAAPRDPKAAVALRFLPLLLPLRDAARFCSALISSAMSRPACFAALPIASISAARNGRQSGVLPSLVGQANMTGRSINLHGECSLQFAVQRDFMRKWAPASLVTPRYSSSHAASPFQFVNLGE